ncbi:MULTISPECIES: hypothetical protein [Lysinibacillus]|uniref:Uncharacterized protein n=1 Tax=Lysinibacillus irui TaxID=2998077 RepID=A0AAJ5RKZ1_9BACI|nr:MULTISPECIES: hypothetical protein [Lysinibacillus]WDV04970.1 hypothetical protein OU989_11625 [Lysinibacillus irui]
MLAACNATPPTTTLSIRELPIVPEHIQKNIVSQDNIQLLYEMTRRIISSIIQRGMY